MRHCTDHIPRTLVGPPGELTATVLIAVARHFRTVHPTDVLDAPAREAVVAITAYTLADQTTDPDGQTLARAATAAMPDLRAGITRGEYVLLLHDVVRAAGHQWSDDDNDRVIPRVPGPRPEPVPVPARRPSVPAQPGPQQSGAPVCCGRPMGRDGRQWVCRKCGSWVDSGFTGLALVPAVVKGATV